MEKEIIIKCECQDHAIQFSYDNDIKCVEVSIWERTPKTVPFTLKERLRWCWHIIKTGRPWNDHVLISPDNIGKLKIYIDDIHNQHKPTDKQGGI